VKTRSKHEVKKRHKVIAGTQNKRMNVKKDLDKRGRPLTRLGTKSHGSLYLREKKTRAVRIIETEVVPAGSDGGGHSRFRQELKKETGHNHALGGECFAHPMRKVAKQRPIEG